jgi:hypothetical protein
MSPVPAAALNQSKQPFVILRLRKEGLHEQID